MKKFIGAVAVLSIFFSLSVSSVNAQTEGEQKQLSEELKEMEEKLQKQVLELNEKLGQYSVLKEWELRYSPVQTRLRKSDEYLELESYSFIPRYMGSPVFVGKKTKIMRLYFSGDSVSKVENIIEELNFETKVRTYTLVVDPSPGSADTNDITVEHVELNDFDRENPLEDKKAYKTTLGDMKNTISLPFRIQFLRDFYVTQLKTFETLYAGSKKLQERFGSNNDMMVIKSLKKSMTVH